MGEFRVGYGRTNITPDKSLPLASYGNPSERWFTRILNELYYTAIAFTDAEDNTVVITTYDITQCGRYILE